MAYRLIKGQFHLFYQFQRHVGSRPDGDSVWFKPYNKHHLANIGDRKVDYNNGGIAQLRFEGIDALELHYKGSNHQKIPECVAARDRLLQLIGFTNVTYAPSDGIDNAVRTASPHPIEGYILTRNADLFGRPVAFAFVGSTSQKDGGDFWLIPRWMTYSLNAQLIADGYAYPTHYTGLPTDIRKRLTNLVKKARKKESSIWQVDSSLSGAQVGSAFDLEQLVIWPKLYRRLFIYFTEGNTGVADFKLWLRSDPKRDDQPWRIRKYTRYLYNDK